MRKWLCMLVCCLSVYVQAQVWTLKEKEPTAPGTWWCFRNTVTLEELSLIHISEPTRRS